MRSRKEFRIWVSNKPGILWRICDALHKKGINIRTLAGIAGQDILAVVTDQENETRKVFEKLGLTYAEFELIVVRVTNMPGEIAFFAKKLADFKINIDSVYMLGESKGKGEMAFVVDDVERAKQVLGLL